MPAASKQMRIEIRVRIILGDIPCRMSYGRRSIMCCVECCIHTTGLLDDYETKKIAVCIQKDGAECGITPAAMG